MIPPAFRPVFLSRELPRGFSMVELVVSTAILAFLGAVIFRFLGRLRDSAQPTLSDRMVVNMESTRAVNLLIDHIRECLEVVRPTIGETTPFLVLRNAVNEMNMLFLQDDAANSARAQRKLYRLVSCCTSATSPHGESRVLFDSIQRLTFTCASPNQVQINLAIRNSKGEFGLVTQVGLLSFNGLD